MGATENYQFNYLLFKNLGRLIFQISRLAESGPWNETIDRPSDFHLRLFQLSFNPMNKCIE